MTDEKKKEAAEVKNTENMEKGEEKESKSADAKAPLKDSEKAEKTEKTEKPEKPDKTEKASQDEDEEGVVDPGRRLRFGINTIIFTGLVIVGLVLVNVISARVHTRADLTEDKLYSLSDASKELVQNLPRDLKVKLFVSRDLIPGYTSTAQYIRDLLEEYKNASNGRFKWEIIHPEEDEKFKKEAERYGIADFVARAQSSTALEAKTITFGMVIQYHNPETGESVEVIPRLFPGIEQNIEYLLTERIKRLTVKRKKIRFVSGHGEFPVQQEERVKEFLSSMFNHYEVEIAPVTQPIPDEVDILVILTPQKPYTPEEVKNIDQFLMKGEKGALFMLDGMTRKQAQQMMPDQQMPNIFMAAENGLEGLLDSWGVKVNPDIVMDQQLQLFPTQGGMIFHPAIPAVRVPGLRNTVTPFLASSLEINRAYLGQSVDKMPEGQSFVILPIMASSDKAWTQEPPFIFDLQRKPRPPSGEPTKAFVMGVLIEGRLPSAVAGEDDSLLGKSKSKNRVVVIGDADMLWLSRQMQGNAIFLQNIMDRLAQDETLIQLRNKTAQDRALTLPDGKNKMLAIKAANMLGLPFLVVLFGFLLALYRRYKRSRSVI